jgi:hypothetical protein
VYSYPALIFRLFFVDVHSYQLEDCNYVWRYVAFVPRFCVPSFAVFIRLPTDLGVHSLPFAFKPNLLPSLVNLALSAVHCAFPGTIGRSFDP